MLLILLLVLLLLLALPLLLLLLLLLLLKFSLSFTRTPYRLPAGYHSAIPSSYNKTCLLIFCIIKPQISLSKYVARYKTELYNVLIFTTILQEWWVLLKASKDTAAADKQNRWSSLSLIMQTDTYWMSSTYPSSSFETIKMGAKPMQLPDKTIIGG